MEWNFEFVKRNVLFLHSSIVVARKEKCEKLQRKIMVRRGKGKSLALWCRKCQYWNSCAECGGRSELLRCLITEACEKVITSRWMLSSLFVISFPARKVPSSQSAIVTTINLSKTSCTRYTSADALEIAVWKNMLVFISLRSSSPSIYNPASNIMHGNAFVTTVLKISFMIWWGGGAKDRQKPYKFIIWLIVIHKPASFCVCYQQDFPSTLERKAYSSVRTINRQNHLMNTEWGVWNPAIFLSS